MNRANWLDWAFAVIAEYHMVMSIDVDSIGANDDVAVADNQRLAVTEVCRLEVQLVIQVMVVRPLHQSLD